MPAEEKDADREPAGETPAGGKPARTRRGKKKRYLPKKSPALLRPSVRYTLLIILALGLLCYCIGSLGDLFHASSMVETSRHFEDDPNADYEDVVEILAGTAPWVGTGFMVEAAGIVLIAVFILLMLRASVKRLVALELSVPLMHMAGLVLVLAGFFVLLQYDIFHYFLAGGFFDEKQIKAINKYHDYFYFVFVFAGIVCGAGFIVIAAGVRGIIWDTRLPAPKVHFFIYLLSSLGALFLLLETLACFLMVYDAGKIDKLPFPDDMISVGSLAGYLVMAWLLELLAMLAFITCAWLVYRMVSGIRKPEHADETPGPGRKVKGR